MKTTIQGEVISVKFQDSGYGVQTKILVRLENGNRVFGTCPKALLWEDLVDERGPYSRPVDILGRRVRFNANITPKTDDFGFFSRPTKAELI